MTPARFQGSGLTTCALRGANFLGVSDQAAAERRVELAVQASEAGERVAEVGEAVLALIALSHFVEEVGVAIVEFE